MPFKKNQDDGLGMGPIEIKERDHDEDFSMLDAVAQDLLSAVEKKDTKLLKEALASLCQHIQTLDEQQDQSLGE